MKKAFHIHWFYEQDHEAAMTVKADARKKGATARSCINTSQQYIMGANPPRSSTC